MLFERHVPEVKDFYTVVKASITLSAECTPASSIDVLAERIRYVNGVATPTGETETIPLQRSTNPNDVEGEGPQRSWWSNAKTWTYRTHLEPDAIAHRLPGSDDWQITNRKGRWCLRVASSYTPGGHFDPTEFKIDKRSQIVQNAMDWVTYFQDHKEWGINAPGGVFHHCFSFAAHIYNKHGLTIPGNDGTATFGAATAPDSGKGSLRFFWTNTTPDPPTGPGNLGHQSNRIRAT